MLTNPIQPGTISRKHLSFEIKTKSKSVSANGAAGVQPEKLTLAEDVDTVLTALGTDQDGKGVKASATNRIPAVALALQKGLAGTEIEVASHEIRDVLNNCTPGSELFLGDNGEITETPSMNSGEIFQRLGRALSPSKIAIDVELAYNIQ